MVAIGTERTDYDKSGGGLGQTKILRENAMDNEDLEVWRQIPGYEGYYDVSNCSAIRSWRTGGGFHLKCPYLKHIQRDKDGYSFVLLYKDKHLRGFRVARLVLYAFVGMPSPGMEASHCDGDKTNNRLTNLVWESRLDNERRKKQHGTRPCGEANWAHKVMAQQVLEARELRASGAKLDQLAIKYGVTATTIYNICKGKTWANI
jgi:hypothetical protein